MSPKILRERNLGAVPGEGAMMQSGQESWFNCKGVGTHSPWNEGVGTTQSTLFL